MTATVQTHPLISIRSNATVQEAARLMADCSIGAIGVLGPDKRFAGIITERDLSWLLAQGKDGQTTSVTEAANDFPVIVDGPVDDVEALKHMSRARVRHLIVREADDVRIVSMRDYLGRRTDEDEQPPTAKDVMTAPAVACRSDAFFEEIAEILFERDISGMPVVDGSGTVVGVVSERDLAHALGGPLVRLAVRRRSRGFFISRLPEVPRGARQAKDIMTFPPVTVAVHDALGKLAGLMWINQISRLPVIDEGRLVGVVTRGDLLAKLGHLQRAESDLAYAPTVVGGANFQHT